MRRILTSAALLVSLPLALAVAQSPSARAAAGCELPVSTPAAEGVDPVRLQQLVDSARAARSDAFVVLKNGRVIAEWYSDSGRAPIQTMSATKSIVGLAIGRLLLEGRLDSLDQPVRTLYPEWAQGRKREITIRHLLNHTSGLQDVPSDVPEIQPAPDAVQLALAAELSAAPGAHWFYSNKATNLLAGIVMHASGRPLDEYVREALLRPLCIEGATWQFRDRAGTPYAMAGLALHARDLAKIGQMMLDGGRWNGATILSKSFVDASVSASQPHESRYGLLWWIEPEWSRSTVDSALVRTWRDAGVEAELVDRLAPLVGRSFEGAEWRAAYDSVLGAPPGSHQGVRRLSAAAGQRAVPMRRVVVGPPRGWYANGSLGQWLLVLPEERLVIVRLVHRRPGHRASDTFHDLPEATRALLGRR